MTKRHPDEVAPEFWTNERLHAFLAIWRGEDGIGPDWWVYWDYATWTLFLVENHQWDWEDHPGGVRGLCPLGDFGDPMPEVPYLIGEPPAAPWTAPWMQGQYVQLEMSLE